MYKSVKEFKGRKQFTCCERDYHENCFQKWLSSGAEIQEWHEGGESVKKVKCPQCDQLFTIEIMEIEQSRICAVLKYLKDYVNLDFVRRCLSCEYFNPGCSFCCRWSNFNRNLFIK